MEVMGLIDDLFRRAERAGMTPWAYAVHSCRSEDLKHATIYRAMTDIDFGRQVIARHVRARGHMYVCSSG